MSSQTYYRSDNAEVYRSNASFVYSSAYTSAVLALLDPQPGDKILDLGCGSGELTLQLAHAVTSTGRIVGQDASHDMIAKTTEPVANAVPSSSRAPIELIAQEAESRLPTDFHGSFNKVFSNAALHWVKRDPALVLSNIFSYLRPGGRFAAEMGGFLNTVGVRGQLHAALRRRGKGPEKCDPWFFPTPTQYKTLLKQTGFRVDNKCELVPRITALPKHSGIKGWLNTFAGPFLNEIEGEDERAKVVQEVEDALRPDCYDRHSGV